LQGFTENDAAAISPLFATTLSIQETYAVDLAEWDALITTSGAPWYIDHHLFILAFGGPLPPTSASSGYGQRLDFKARVLSTEMEVPDNLTAAERELALELAEKLKGPPYFGITEVSEAGVSGSAPEGIEPFLRSRTGLPLAGRYLRRGGKAECWAIPATGADLRWIQLALKRWQLLDPQRFPGDADWKHSPEWMTRSEKDAADLIEAISQERATQLAGLDQKLAAASEDLSQARDTADSAERLLLSSQSADLVQAVLSALTTFGFDVKDMDTASPSSPKVEDLRVSIPGIPWRAVAEVKGYKEGAKTNDLARFIRYSELYIKEVGRPPDAKWYIVNQYRNDDPATRPRALRGADADIEIFADVGGLIIDSRDLLRLLLSVNRGDLTPETARTLLRDARGLFVYPALPHDSTPPSDA
jgi:hypothetical protein